MHETFSDWIGRSVTRDDVVTPRLVLEFSATMAPFLFTPADGDGLPPGLHWAIAPPAPGVEALAPDGSEAKGVFLPPIPLPRRMWAGGSIESFAPFRLGMAVSRQSRIADLKLRDSQGGPLCFVSIDHAFRCDGALLLRERQDLVFRDGGPRSGKGTEAPPAADIAWQVPLSPLLLFRFSAITFNGHRIHYDHPYAVATEGYAGLVTHGPLQAALLFNQAAALLGAIPARFDYRCTAPLIAGQTATVASVLGHGGASGRIADAAGVVTVLGDSRVRGTAAA